MKKDFLQKCTDVDLCSFEHLIEMIFFKYLQNFLLSPTSEESVKISINFHIITTENSIRYAQFLIKMKPKHFFINRIYIVFFTSNVSIGHGCLEVEINVNQAINQF